MTVYLDGQELGAVAPGEIKGFTVTSDATKEAHLLAVEGDGATYSLDVKDVHANGFTWGLFEGDGVEAKN